MCGSAHVCHVWECTCMSCGKSVHACLVGCAHAPLIKSYGRYTCMVCGGHTYLWCVYGSAHVSCVFLNALSTSCFEKGSFVHFFISFHSLDGTLDRLSSCFVQTLRLLAAVQAATPLQRCNAPLTWTGRASPRLLQRRNATLTWRGKARPQNWKIHVLRWNSEPLSSEKHQREKPHPLSTATEGKLPVLPSI